jgi:hypothetical protein
VCLLSQSMAHHFPAENGDRGDDEEIHEEGRLPQSVVKSVPLRLLHQQHAGAFVRSSPIAIVRNPEDQKRHIDTSDDDDSTTDMEFDTLSISARTRSPSSSLPPSLLLRAPQLGSIQTVNESWIDRYPAMLPPAVQLSEHPLGATPHTHSLTSDRGTAMSYGSLRDSHQRGRFLDGPSSYRDRQTGDIRRVQNRVRFQDTGKLASSMPTSLSIGERIMMSRQLQVSRIKQKEPSTSSLSALLEASDVVELEPDPLPNLQSATVDATVRTSTLYDVDSETRLPSHMLSTSLTGLEVLRSGLRRPPPPMQAEPGSLLVMVGFMGDQLPRDSGRNALLGRTLSDPTPRHGLLQSIVSASPLSDRNYSMPPPLLSNSSSNTYSGADSFAAVSPTNDNIPYAPVGAPFREQDSLVESTSELHEPLDHDPDTDFAFDLEME